MKLARCGPLRASLMRWLVGLGLTLPLLGMVLAFPLVESPEGHRSGNRLPTRSLSASPTSDERNGSVQSAAQAPPSFGGGNPPGTNNSERPHAPRRVLVGTHPGERAQAENSIRGQGGRVVALHRPGDFYIVETPSQAPDWARSVRGRPGVRFAEPDYLLKGDAVPNDPRWPDMWGLKKIGMETAWNTTRGSNTVVVGVIDSGVDYAHADIGAAPMWTNPSETINGIDDDGNGLVDDIYGADCVNDDGDPMDDNNHGTHVAGTVGGATNNATGVAAMNWSVKIMALKFLGADGSGYLSDAVQCIDYAISKKAHVTNNSWSGGPFSQALYDAIGRARNAGQLFVAAAGNSNLDNDLNPSYPASYDLDNIVSVAASDSNDARATFSNYGKTTVDVAAPGVSILSTVRGGYSYFNGTSMAAPHVAGTAALMLAKSGTGVSYTKVRDAILSSVDPVGGLDGVVATGGRLNAARAIQVELAPATTLTPSGVVIESGRLRSGSPSGLVSDDNSYYSVNSTTSRTRISSWYGVFTTLPSSVGSLKVTYRGKNSATCAQTVSIWRYTTSSWVQLNSRSVSTSEVSIADLAPPGSLADYISAPLGGEVRIRVRCTRSSGSFYSSGELMNLVYKAT